MSYSIYLVEDEENLNELLTKYLESEGWHVTSFLNGESARQKIGQSPHLWILDIMLPDIDGYTLIKEIKIKIRKSPSFLFLRAMPTLTECWGLNWAAATIYLSRFSRGADHPRAKAAQADL